MIRFYGQQYEPKIREKLAMFRIRHTRGLWSMIGLKREKKENKSCKCLLSVAHIVIIVVNSPMNKLITLCTHLSSFCMITGVYNVAIYSASVAANFQWYNTTINLRKISYICYYQAHLRSFTKQVLLIVATSILVSFVNSLLWPLAVQFVKCSCMAARSNIPELT